MSFFGVAKSVYQFELLTASQNDCIITSRYIFTFCYTAGRKKLHPLEISKTAGSYRRRERLSLSHLASATELNDLQDSSALKIWSKRPHLFSWSETVILRAPQNSTLSRTASYHIQQERLKFRSCKFQVGLKIQNEAKQTGIAYSS
jgi:hypothetical protein